VYHHQHNHQQQQHRHHHHQKEEFNIINMIDIIIIIITSSSTTTSQDQTLSGLTCINRSRKLEILQQASLLSLHIIPHLRGSSEHELDSI
jgi:hypothetical protein